MSLQKTIKKSVTVEGLGLFGGERSKLRFCPSPANTGVRFVRMDLPAPLEIPVTIASLAERSRTTSLVNGPAGAETVEHVLSAVAGMGIDNLLIELSGNETPSTDGSSLPFAQALESAGFEEQDVPRNLLIVEQPLTVSQGDNSLSLVPGPADCLDIVYDLNYPSIPSIGRQVFSFRLGRDDYMSQLAPARTFLLEAEAREFQARGWGKHLTTRDILVVGDAGPIDNRLRFPDEYVRHKICDLIGDLLLLGRPLRGRIIACRSGHELNHELIRKLLEGGPEKKPALQYPAEPVLDIRKIMRLLPHRYPFLMIDRVVSIDEDRHAVAIKNVTINEPFFQGHYPGLPIMPGVMIVEAMAQLSGILLSRRLEHTGKVAVLLSMDRVKMRRPVRPGDQLILHAEALHVRARTGHCQCKAMVGQEIAAEAEIKFMLVDAEPA
ncbi:MAG: UDP-3-O-[3-hydroxymyristoyl] N-acetylglucosamine deacetylase [Planctomycetes bacterium]|nr:UDP-3-O-[3-hydroxymyristoyl] N-acetylglucosamine deacetylase [Planctomycetota bacterium]